MSKVKDQGERWLIVSEAAYTFDRPLNDVSKIVIEAE